MAYMEVKAEMARRKLRLVDLAEDPRLDCTVSTISQKLNRKYPMTLDEAKAIKDILGTSMSLEQLFEES